MDNYIIYTIVRLPSIIVAATPPFKRYNDITADIF
jgi:hypothetical protein